jgi:hypothetical protein
MNSASEPAFFSLVAILTAVSLWRELPLQSVAAVGLVMYAVAALWFWVMKEPCWWLPLIVLNSRGASRLILHSVRHTAYYGWWTTGLTCLLSTLLRPHWSTPALALAMQLAAVPWLIKRRPGRDDPSYFAVVNWMLAAGWIAYDRF